MTACRLQGLDVHLYDARPLTGDSFGPFDASFGAFEHFCSPRHEKAATVLPDDGRFYLQTMVFGRTMIAPEAIDIDAIRHAVPPRDSDELYLALLSRQSPGSWLPFCKEQIVRSAEPYRAG